MSEMLSRREGDMPNEEPESSRRQKSMRSADRILQELRDVIRAEQTRQEAKHEHRWEVAGINAPPADAPDPTVRSVFNFSHVYTYVLLRCSECGWQCALELPGNWSENQIRGIEPERGIYGYDTSSD